MNHHLHAAGLLEHLRKGEPTPNNIWFAIQTLFAAMNEVHELIASRLGSKTKVVTASSPGYAGMPPALQFVYAMLILIAEGKGWRKLETSEVGSGSGMGRCVSCSEGFLRASGYNNCAGRGTLS